MSAEEAYLRIMKKYKQRPSSSKAKQSSAVRRQHGNEVGGYTSEDQLPGRQPAPRPPSSRVNPSKEKIYSTTHVRTEASSVCKSIDEIV